MSAIEKSTSQIVSRVTITAKRELARRQEIEAIRRDMLWLQKEFNRKYAALAERLGELLND